MRAIDADEYRKCLIDHMTVPWERAKYDISDDYNKGLYDAARLLNTAPTIQPEQNWIPCNIGLPNIGESVLVTLDTEEVCEMKLWEVAGVEQYWCDPYDGYTYEFDRVLAWCEKPEPYKGVME